MISPNLSNSTGSDERFEGEYSSTDSLTLELSEDDIARAVGNRVEDAERFWNEKLNLDTVRETNEKFWMNQYLDESALHDFQVPYKNNRIFTAIESLGPMVLARPAMPLITESYDSDASRELARNLQKTLLAKYEDLYLKSKFQMAVKHLLVGYRIAFMKYRWDNSIGFLTEGGKRTGDIAVDCIRPQRVVIDAGANDPDNIPLIGEYKMATVEELCYDYPAKKDDVYKALGIQRGVTTQMSKQAGKVEVWFSYMDKKTGEMREAVTWKMKNLVLDSMKNPNWNYDETMVNDAGETVRANFFDKPQKPYISFSHLNLGRYLIDDTSLTEQAAPLQKVLDKRGRQIVENADAANSGTIFNGEMVKHEDVAQLLGDPKESLVVNGPVTAAAMRLPTNILPSYVIQDKQDARAEIDNIFGTHDPIRGQDSGSKTLGQDVLSQRADLSRTQSLATSIEDGADRLYKGMVQMMKVFYDETQMIKYSGPDGKTSFLEFSRSKIEDGVKVRVKSGSVLPDDPATKRQETIQMMAVLDPLSIAEGLNKEDPKEWAKRNLYWKMAPDKYMSEILGVNPATNGQDPQALQEEELMLQGQAVPPQTNPSKEHLATHQALLESPTFKQSQPDIQQLVIQHVKAEMQRVKASMGDEEAAQGMPGNQPTTQAPPPAATQEQPTATNSVPPKGLSGAVRSLFGR